MATIVPYDDQSTVKLSTEWNIQISLAMVEPPLIVRRDCMKRNIKKTTFCNCERNTCSSLSLSIIIVVYMILSLLLLLLNYSMESHWTDLANVQLHINLDASCHISQLKCFVAYFPTRLRENPRVLWNPTNQKMHGSYETLKGQWKNHLFEWISIWRLIFHLFDQWKLC